MPSATRNNRRPAYPESWLLLRIFPTWETAALIVRVPPGSPSQLEGRRADRHGGLRRDRRRQRHARAVEVGAVGGVEVLDDPVLAPQHEPRVVGRGVVV